MSTVLLVTLALVTTAAPRRTTILVLDTVDQSGSNALLAKQMTQVIAGEVARNPQLSAVSSSEIRQAIGVERQKQLLGCTENGCLAELGSAMGADYLLTTSIAKIGTRYRLDVRLLKGSNARIVASAGDFVGSTEDAVADAAVSFTDEVLAAAKMPVPPRLTQPAKPPTTAAANTAAPSATAADPTATVASTKAAPEARSRTPAYVLLGTAGVLAVGATVMTISASNTFNNAVRDHSDPSSLSWKSPLADGLWAGALVSAGVGTYLYFSASPSPSGGGAVAVGGSF